MGAVVNPLVSGIAQESRHASKTITFDGTAGKGAIGTFDVFAVTGEVYIERIVPFCETNIGVDGGTGAASMQFGHANASNALVASTPAADIDAGEFWVDATPDADMVAIPAGMKDFALTQHLKGEVTSTGTQKVNAGVLRFDAWWRPLSPDGNLA